MRKYEVRSLKYDGRCFARTSYFVLRTSWSILPDGPIAQRLEPPAHNRPVPGSNPGGPTNLRSLVHAKVARRSAEREGGRAWVREIFGWRAVAPRELRLASLVRRSPGAGGPTPH